MFYRQGQTVYCNNCGGRGHTMRRCAHPILSYGVVCLRLGPGLREFTEHLVTSLGAPASEKAMPCEGGEEGDLQPFIEQITANMQLILMRRANSFAYVQYVRGKYDASNKTDTRLMFSRMSMHELGMVRAKSFDELWADIWGSSAWLPRYHDEYMTAKDKAQRLITLGAWDMLTSEVGYGEPEWGVPKGRRNSNESNLQCGLREFEEETGVSRSDVTHLAGVQPLEEVVVGSNNVQYKHVYFLSVVRTGKADDLCVHAHRPEQYREVGDVRWADLTEACALIRPYNTQRIALFKDIVAFLASQLREYEAKHVRP